MVAIVVEGKRDVKFFRSYIVNHLNIKKDRFKIIKTDGKSILLDNSCDKYENLCGDLEVGRIQKVLFIIDSDNRQDNPDIGGFENSVKKIKELISSLSIKDFSDYFIACDPKTSKGNIENLVISTLTALQVNCINDFLDCSELENDDSKRLLGIYNYGYPEKPYDFNHTNFDKLKEKLQDLFS